MLCRKSLAKLAHSYLSLKTCRLYATIRIIFEMVKKAFPIAEGIGAVRPSTWSKGNIFHGRRLGPKEIFFMLIRENGSFFYAGHEKHFLLIGYRRLVSVKCSPCLLKKKGSYFEKPASVPKLMQTMGNISYQSLDCAQKPKIEKNRGEQI